MLLQFAGVFVVAEGDGGKRFCCNAPQKKACTVLFVSPSFPVFEGAGGPTGRVASTGGEGCGLNPLGPMTDGSLAQNHSTLMRDHRPKLKTVPAASFQLEVMPTSYRPLALQSAEAGSPV